MRRTRIAAAGVLLVAAFAIAAPAAALWMAIPVGELARDSDAIVIGRLVDSTAVGHPTGPFGDPVWSVTTMRGTLQVDTTLWSRSPARRSLIVEWPVDRSGPTSYDLTHLMGCRVLWLLERVDSTENGLVYGVDHPRRFIRVDNRAEVENVRRDLGPPPDSLARVALVRDVLDRAAARLRPAISD